MTVEEKAEELQKAALEFCNKNMYRSDMWLDAYFIAGYNMRDGESQWVNSIKETPSLIDGHDYSENVFGIVDGQLGVYCYCRLISETPEESGYFC